MVDSQMIQQYAALRTKAEILSTRGELLSPVEQQTMDRLLSYAQTSLSPSELARTADAVDALVAQGHQQAMMQQSQHDAARALRAQDEVTRDLTGGQLQFAHQLAPAAAGEKYVVPGKQGIHPDTMESTVKGMMSDLGKPDWGHKDFMRVVNRHDELKMSRSPEAAQKYLDKQFGEEHAASARDVISAYESSGVGLAYELQQRRGGVDEDVEVEPDADTQRRAQITVAALQDAAETPEDNMLLDDEFQRGYLESETSLSDVAAAWIQHEEA